MLIESNLVSPDIRGKLILSIGALLTLVGIAGYFVVHDSQNRLIEHQAVTVAEIVVRQATASRSVYAQNIVGEFSASVNKKAHLSDFTLPIPSRFLKDVSIASSGNSAGLYEYRPVSKWNLSQGQSLNNAFLSDAWENLESQDQAAPDKAIEWQPFFRIEQVEGKDTLMYLRADPAIGASCVSCHNAYEKRPDIVKLRLQQGVTPGKTWKQHQLLGAIYVQIPIDKVRTLAFKEGTMSIAWIVVILTAGLVLLAFFLLGDVAKAKEVSKQLLWQARHDPLTKLPNRSKFAEQTSLLIGEAKNDGLTHAMCFLDLDRFKLVNDTCGHAAGDELLCEISDIIRKHLCNRGLLARLGGDEFGILLRDCNADEVMVLSQELCMSIKRFEFLRGGHNFNVGASIGVMMIDRHAKNVESVVSCADLACYSAKKAGRNGVELYQDGDQEFTKRTGEISWISRILHALEEKKIVIYYQAISAIASDNDHTHYEVLARLIDEENGVILPNSFLPAATRYDLMDKIDLAIIERTFYALSHNKFGHLPEGCFVSINLSGQSLSNKHFLTKVGKLLQLYQVNPRQVCFEITESAAINNLVLVQQFIAEMKNQGVTFALDDFGTGLSSLSYLKQFSVDYLKIDGRFIRDIVSDSIDRTLVLAINQMAHAMGLRTVAEYVQSKEILDLLTEMDIDYAQGNYINQPTVVVM